MGPTKLEASGGVVLLAWCMKLGTGLHHDWNPVRILQDLALRFK